MNIGYIRVSSKDQNLERQEVQMRELGIEDRFIFRDKASGKDFDRPEYQNMKRTLREGDTLYLCSLDRLGRNYDNIIKQWKEITLDIGADIICLDSPELFNTKKWREMGDIGKVMSDIMLSLLSYVAESERNKIKQRQAEGIEIAKKTGKYTGRKAITVKKEPWLVEYSRWKNGNQTARLAMQHLSLKTNTFYKLVKDYENGLMVWAE